MESLESQVPATEEEQTSVTKDAAIVDPSNGTTNPVAVLDKPSLDKDADLGQSQGVEDKPQQEEDVQNGEKLVTENGDGEHDDEAEEEDVAISECLDDPHFAIVCSFLDKFGPLLRLDRIPYDDLQAMLETTVTIPEPLLKLHIVLLRRVFKSIAVDKWERSLAKFCHFYSTQDGWEIERFGYKNAKLQTKLRLLKHLLEAQFDFNVKFKAEVNKLESGELRLIPLGQDCEGQLYWYQVDEEANLRVYREDVDDESWEVVACTRKGLCELITKLELGDVKKRTEEPLLLDEDSNEKEIEVKEILRDTGKFEEAENDEEEDDEGDETSEDSDTDSKKLESSPSKNKVVKNDEETKHIVEESQVKSEDIVDKVVSAGEKEVDMEVDEEPKTEPTKELPMTDNSNAINIKVEIKPVEAVTSSPVPSAHTGKDKLESELLPQEPIPDKSKSVDNEKETIVAVQKNETLSFPLANTLGEAKLCESENYVNIPPPSLKEEVDHPSPSPQSITLPQKLPVEEPPFVKKETWVCGEGDLDKDANNSIQIQNSTALSVPSTEPAITDKEATVQPVIPDDISIKKEPEMSVASTPNTSTPAVEIVAVKPEQPLAVSEPKEDKSKGKLPTEPPQADASISLQETTANEIPPHQITAAEPTPPKPVEETVQVSKKPDQEQESKKKPNLSELSTDPPVAKESLLQPPSEGKKSQHQPPLPTEIPAKAEVETSKESNSQSQLPLPAEVSSEAVSEKESSTSKPESLQDSAAKTKDPVVDKEPVASKPATTLPTAASKPNPFGSLVSYGSSDDDDEDEGQESTEKPVEIAPISSKRKAEENESDLLQPSKVLKVEESPLLQTTSSSVVGPPLNPIVGEAVEESVMMVVGSGSGAECQGGNNEDELLENNQKENVAETASQSLGDPSVTNIPVVKRGRGRPGKKSLGGSAAPTPSPKKTTPKPRKRSKSPSGGAPRGRKRRELEGLGVPLDALEVNGSSGGDGGIHSERPVRASRRIAQIRLKEEEERRKMEEEQLAQLKAAQLLRKQQKKIAAASGEAGEASPAKKKTNNKIGAADYVPGSPSAGSSSSQNSDNSEAEDFAIHPKKKRGRKKKMTGKPGRPWATDSDDTEEDQGVEEEEEYHYEEEDHDHDHLRLYESDHEFSPESDLGEDDDALKPSRHARTAKRGQVEAEEEMGCKKCGKGDHPEWILLCDKCDAGWHASCLRPQLWVIPEGEWFCPPCQHSKLVSKLNENLLEYDKLLQRRENDDLKRQRLTYVGISLENVLPDPEEEVTESGSKSRHRKSPSPSRKGNKHKDRGRGHRSEKRSSRRRRIILSDEEISDNFIASSENSSDDEKSGGHNSLDDEDSDGPIYRLRARRSAKTFDYKEYDDLINSACRASDEEFGPEEPLLENNGGGKHMPGEEEDEFEPENEEEEEEDDEPSGGGGGKNAAYEQHLKKAEEEKELADKEKAAKENKTDVTDDTTDAATGVAGPKAAKSKAKSAAVEGEEEETDEDELDEKEKKRRALKKASAAGNKKKKRSFRNLDDFSEDDNSDEDFHGSDVDDDEDGEEDAVEEDAESDWSGDQDDSDDSIAAASRQRGGKKGKYGRKDEYLDVGAVRRSTRAVRRKARVSYDESDDDDDDDGEEGGDKWNSDENSEEEEETGSESDDETYGKSKRKKAAPKRSATPRFLLGAVAASKKKKGGSGGGNKKRKKRGDEEEVDRAWNSSQGSKAKKSAAEEKVERRTRGRKINFKDILDSDLESDDDGNVLPKRRRLSSGEEDEDEAEASRRLAERIKAANQREAAMYAKRQKEAQAASEESNPGESNSSGAVGPAEPATTTDQIPVAQISCGVDSPVVDAVEKKDKPIIEHQPLLPPGPAVGQLPPPLLAVPPPPIVVPASVSASSYLELEMALAKPVPAPPLPPALAKALARGSGGGSKKKSKGGEDGAEKAPRGKSKKGSTDLPHFLPPSSSPVGPTPIPPPSSVSNKSSSSHPVTVSSSSIITSLPSNLPNPIQQQHGLPITSQSQMLGMGPGGLGGLHMSPSMFSSNSSSVRSPFHPMWGRPPGGGPPPPYGMSSPPPNSSIGKPPPLNNSPFMPQHPSSARPGYPPGSGPPLRIPNPSSNPALQQAAAAQAFQHFRRDGGGMYRPNQPGGLPPGLLAGFQGSPERFFGAPSPYGPYGMMPPQGPQGFFGPSPFDPFRPAGSETFKDEPRSTPPSLNPSQRSSGHGRGPSSPKDQHHESPAGPHPHLIGLGGGGLGHPVPIPPTSESEFGGLVSYFSSQRSEEDMDS